MSDNVSLEAVRLVALLDVEGRLLRAASRQAAAFTLVNELPALTPYRQAVLWGRRAGIEAVSGLALPEKNAPFMLWMDQVFQALGDYTQSVELTAADLPSHLAEPWMEWLPPYALLLPWGDVSLLLARDEPWQPLEKMLLERLGEAARIVWRSHDRAPGWRVPGVRRRWKSLAIAAAVLAVALCPVTGSVLAPAEMVAAEPAVVRSPLGGVIDHIYVKPNDGVVEGQPLFDLDATILTGQLDVAREQVATAEAEYREADQAQVFDPKAKAQVAILRGKMDEMTAEANALQSQLERIHVKAPRAGIAIFDDPSDWVGRPVEVGERVMQVAAETDTAIDAWLAVPDAAEAKPGARLTLFLNTTPLAPLHALVRTVAYEATARPDGTLAYRVRAALLGDGEKPRLGLKGTARIDGAVVPLIWWLFRRPLATARQTVGF